MKPSLYALALLLFGLGNATASNNLYNIWSSLPKPVLSVAHTRADVSLANETLRTIRTSTKPTRTLLAYTAQRRPVHAYFFPGKVSEYAFVIGGMHGSELSSIEVAKAVVDSLQNGAQPYYSVVVIPSLFPDNAVLASSYPDEIGSTKNIGRYSSGTAADPNRQMPSLGSPFLPEKPLDFAGRVIERENQALLYLIENLHPRRIASLHAIRNPNLAGVFADPRTDGYGFAEGYEADSLVAVEMAKQIGLLGGTAPGNKLEAAPTALYHSDPAVAPKGCQQKRTVQGGNSGHQRGFGVSLGSWASTSERAYEESAIPRSAAMMLTVEFPGSRRTIDYEQDADKLACRKNVQAYASAIVSVMLQQGVI
ncbi:M14 family metallopeptidase [Pseudocnuella soli]|uniref:hypothetical protein n=1 Tax=Pseudocnuella soli TaxID=2502779 RepID=UPI00104E7C17|nr:hypothetical protein [Pseudocnuella soli]